MDKLFSGVDVTFGDKKLSTEMIDIQKNDAVVPMLEKCYQELIDLNNEYNFNTGKMFFKHPKSKKVIRRMDEILKDRFGIPFHHINNRNGTYGIYTSPPLNYNVLNRDITEIYKYTASEVVPGDDTDIDDFSSDPIKVYAKWLANVESINKKLNTDGVYVDLHKARITGLPKEYKLILGCNLRSLIGILKLDAKELVAVLLHEVGHAFTHIEYSYRGYTVTNVLVDTLKENILKKNKGIKETLYLTYRELGGTDKIEGVNVTVATLKTVALLKNSFLLKDTDSNHNYSDNEQLADQFTGRFGLGLELASGLEKMDDFIDKHKSFDVGYATSLSMALLISIGLLSLILGSLFFGLLMTLLLSFIIALTSKASELGYGNDDENKYDSDLQRIQRILNEQIRQLRTLDLGKQETKDMINSIETVKTILSKYYKKENTTFTKIAKYLLTPINDKYVNYKEMEQLIENLSENELHVSGRKLKTLV